MNAIASRGLVAAAALAIAACSPPAAQKPSFNAVDITGANYARELALTDADGKPRSLADFRGKVTLVFFGYTQCPDVCPTTLAELAEVKRSLGADGERVQGVFVSVDPERDTPELLKTYVAQFDPSFVALRGTPQQTLATAKEFKVFFAKARQARTARAIRSITPPARSCSTSRGAFGCSCAMAAERRRWRRMCGSCSANSRTVVETAPCGSRSRCLRLYAATSSALRIFFIAATSIWRMRSALTPYSAASSCKVMPPDASSLTLSQRFSTMRRLRASSASSARKMPSLAS